MVDKRMRKLKGLEKEALKPEIVGESEDLIVCWGSTFPTIREATDKRIAYFRQVYPLHKSTKKLLEDASGVTVVENNFTCQFADLLKLETGIDVKRINKYDGLAFSVEELGRELR
jgi:2-oxoglutarate ferredoxin oxidoreductase subunit alpha